MPPQQPSSDEAAAVLRAKKLIHALNEYPGSPAEKWNRLLSQEQLTSTEFAECFGQLHESSDYRLATEGILAAIRSNQAQPWMYSVLPMEMKLADFPQKEIDRALLSHVDFAADDIGQVLITASLLSRMEAWDAAMELLQEHARRDPWRPEIWLKAVTVADRSQKAEWIQWARTGVLKHVWTSNAEQLHAEAVLTLERLIEREEKAKNGASADRLREALREAQICDLRIEAEWAGNGDVDLEVDEPNGVTCGRKSQITKNGGVIVMTASGGETRQKEEYRCQYAPPGDYTIRLELVHGRVVTGRVRVRVTRYLGTPDEKTETVSLPVGTADGQVRITLNRGRRVEPIQ